MHLLCLLLGYASLHLTFILNDFETEWIIIFHTKSFKKTFPSFPLFRKFTMKFIFLLWHLGLQIHINKQCLYIIATITIMKKIEFGNLTAVSVSKPITNCKQVEPSKGLETSGLTIKWTRYWYKKGELYICLQSIVLKVSVSEESQSWPYVRILESLVFKEWWAVRNRCLGTNGLSVVTVWLVELGGCWPTDSEAQLDEWGCWWLTDF